MSEPIDQRLKKLTPDAGGLDRDGLLFAAGRASARPSRRWQALCGLLAAAQAVTFALLFWPAPAVLPVQGLPTPVANAPGSPIEAAPTGEVTVMQLRSQAIATEGNLKSSVVSESVSGDTPLTAGARPESLLQ